MKKIYWIDDNINYISHYVQGIIKELWGNEKEEGISSVIRIFGDGYKESRTEKDWKEEDVKALEEEIQNSMVEHCLDMEAWNWSKDNNVYEKKEKLIQEPPILVKVDGTGIADVIDKWKNLERQDINVWREGEVNVETIRECFKIPVGASVAIDLVLLKGDKERVSKEIPIISMLLYDVLSKAGHKCILYSTFMYDSLFIEKWKDIYNSNRTQDLDAVEIIYPGRQMWEKVKNSNIIEKLKEIAKESEQKKDKGEEISKDECGTEKMRE